VIRPHFRHDEASDFIFADPAWLAPAFVRLVVVLAAMAAFDALLALLA